MKYPTKNVFLILGIAAALALPVLLWLTFDTEYSDDFSSSSWDEAEVGMSEAEVKSTIGEPVSVNQSTSKETKTLNYSKSRSNNSNYVHYYIVIRDGKVFEKKKEIFWD
ncbi:MAG TPA: hypothetical protein VMW24_02635 [Sedimentisphaerales bacterium]|nr:hypothetical protein [Sedimentisphaerales bacterium]